MKTPASIPVRRYTFYFILSTFFLAADIALAQVAKAPTAEIETYYDLHFTEGERDSLLSNLADYQKSYQLIHQYRMPNSVPMSLVFDPDRKSVV